MFHISLSSVWTLVGWLVNFSDLLATAFPVLGLTMHNSTNRLVVVLFSCYGLWRFNWCFLGKYFTDWATSPAQQLHFKSCSNWFYRLSRPFCRHWRPFPNLQASNLLRSITQAFPNTFLHQGVPLAVFLPALWLSSFSAILFWRCLMILQCSYWDLWPDLLSSGLWGPYMSTWFARELLGGKKRQCDILKHGHLRHLLLPAS